MLNCFIDIVRMCMFQVEYVEACYTGSYMLWCICISNIRSALTIDSMIRLKKKSFDSEVLKFMHTVN